MFTQLTNMIDKIKYALHEVKLIKKETAMMQCDQVNYRPI